MYYPHLRNNKALGLLNGSIVQYNSVIGRDSYLGEQWAMDRQRKHSNSDESDLKQGQMCNELLKYNIALGY